MKKGQRRFQHRKGERRRLLTEDEFRRLIETGKTSKTDRRSWVDRRRPKKANREKDTVMAKGKQKNVE
jgi:hypothetical protein